MSSKSKRKETEMQKQLEDQATKAAAVVLEKLDRTEKIAEQIQAANLALAKAKQEDEIHRAKASTGDPAAIAAVKTAHDAHCDAESTIANLRVTLSAAAESLAEAERVAANARHQLANFKVEILIRERVDVAREISKVLADLLVPLAGRYEKLGHQIIDMPDAAVLPNHGFTSDFENAMGAKRLRAAMPAFIQTLYLGAPRDEQQKEDFATAEALCWNLPPEQPEKAKAA
jgi:hypothetical protein